MAITTYLAMTAAEFASCERLPAKLAWMACHFSPYATGLSNFPADLPENSILIVNDIMPIQRHDPEAVASQLSHLIEQQRCSAVLLDFQRTPSDNLIATTQRLCETLPCPTAVSAPLAMQFDCPVFLPTCPVNTSLEAHTAPWKGREIWLEIGYEEALLQITESGTKLLPHEIMQHSGSCFQDPILCAHYQIETQPNMVTVSLWRNPEDIQLLLEKAERLHISTAIGLYQELGNSL